MHRHTFINTVHPVADRVRAETAVNDPQNDFGMCFIYF